MKNLRDKYKGIDFNRLTEKDIIYFCRSDLSIYNTDANETDWKVQKSLYEDEILFYLKQRDDWNWFETDIDRNIILTYPMSNSSFKITEYLLSIKKDNNYVYDLKSYNIGISRSLQSCINLQNDSILSLILSKDIHSEYTTDLLYKCISFKVCVKGEKYKDIYQRKIDFLCNYDINLSSLLGVFKSNTDDFNSIKESLYSVLENHRQSSKESVETVKNFLDKVSKPKSKASKEMVIFLNNWISMKKLNSNLPYKNSVKGMKI